MSADDQEQFLVARAGVVHLGVVVREHRARLRRAREVGAERADAEVPPHRLPLGVRVLVGLEGDGIDVRDLVRRRILRSGHGGSLPLGGGGRESNSRADG